MAGSEKALAHSEILLAIHFGGAFLTDVWDKGESTEKRVGKLGNPPPGVRTCRAQLGFP